jgi:hypothetical protein
MVNPGVLILEKCGHEYHRSVCLCGLSKEIFWQLSNEIEVRSLHLSVPGFVGSLTSRFSTWLLIYLDHYPSARSRASDRLVWIIQKDTHFIIFPSVPLYCYRYYIDFYRVYSSSVLAWFSWRLKSDSTYRMKNILLDVVCSNFSYYQIWNHPKYLKSYIEL